MANNLKDHLKEVADAIRAKKGTSDLINPQDFATEIEGITSGSGGESGSNIEYLDVSGGGGAETFCKGTSSLVKDSTAIVPTSAYLTFPIKDNLNDVVAVAIDFDTLIVMLDGTGVRHEVSLREYAIMIGIATQSDLDSIPRLTKEQFYDLNA